MLYFSSQTIVPFIEPDMLNALNRDPFKCLGNIINTVASSTVQNGIKYNTGFHVKTKAFIGSVKWNSL